jgi:site-specific recombinase XerD
LYRKSLGLTPFPSRTEETPLVCSIETFKEKSPQEEVLEEKSNGKKKKKVKDANDHLTRQSIHNAVKLLIDRTTKRLMELECDEDAEILSRVSSHWFRHTYATKLLDSGASLSTGRDNLGHANISTTNLYSHSGQDKRFDETEGIGKMLKD